MNELIIVAVSVLAALVFAVLGSFAGWLYVKNPLEWRLNRIEQDMESLTMSIKGTRSQSLRAEKNERMQALILDAGKLLMEKGEGEEKAPADIVNALKSLLVKYPDVFMDVGGKMLKK